MRTYETWEVVKALTEHQLWKAKTHETGQLPVMSIISSIDEWSQYNSFQCFHINFGKWEGCPLIQRSDWRLYDETGKEVDYDG